MKIAVVGAGGVGGYFGGMLALAGNAVTFIARGATLDAIVNNGITIISDNDKINVTVAATDDPSRVDSVDLVIFAVKTYDTDAAINSLSSLVSGGASVLTLQNGVESYIQLGEALGNIHVLPGSAYIESSIQSPGVIRQSGHVVRIVFGELDGSKSLKAVQIHGAFSGAGVNCELSTDVVKTLWTKFLFIASVAGLTSACRTRIGDLLDQPGYLDLLLDIMREIENVGRARGVILDDDVVRKTQRYVEEAVKDITASLHIDLENGRRLELETFTGAVVRLGVQAEVATPINDLLYKILKPHVGGRAA
ncbi:2-dehydropantoate 2-reductase [SAR202 cluster bacterium AD-804-J14_MRT_500m]|nr:2-dehydropantoate 2-reductase [SAR202 cluster bacterium AD-804-J14_MRT_500m]